MIKKFLTIACLTIIGSHLIFSAILAFTTSASYKLRMINARHVDFDKALAPSLIGSFLLDAVPKAKRPVVLIVGSSFSWGYAFPEDSIYTSHLQKNIRGKRIVNASLIGDSPADTLGTLCLANELGIRVETLIVEINIANFAARKEIFNGALERCTGPRGWTGVDRVVPYLSFFLQNPFGLSHLKIIRDEQGYKRKDSAFRFNPVSDGYFNTRQEADQTFEAKKSVLLPLLSISKKLSPHVVFFIAPVNEYGVSLSQFKYGDIKYQLNQLIELCKSVGGVQCLETRDDIDKSYFKNLTHLNMKGHEYFAKYLAEELLLGK